VIFLGRRRVLHVRERVREKGVSGRIVLSPSKREELLKELEKKEKELSNLTGQDKLTKQKRLALAREIRAIKLQLGLTTAKGGRRNLLLKIFRGKEDELQSFLINRITYHKKLYEKQYGGEMSYSLLLRKLREDLLKKARENNVILSENEVISERTIRNYIDEHNLLEKKKTTVSLFETDIWKDFVEEKRRKVKPEYFSNIVNTVKSFYSFVKAQYGEDIANDPNQWTAEMVYQFIIDYLYKQKGLSQNTCRSYLIHIRRFWEEGLQRSDLAKLKLREFGKVTERQVPERILYFSTDTINRMIDLVPHKTFEFTFQKPDGSEIKKEFKINSKADREMYKLLIRFMSSTGARTGKMASPKWIGKHIEGILRTWRVPETTEDLKRDMLFNQAQGTVSVRLQDLQYIELDKKKILKMAKELEPVQPLEAERLRSIADALGDKIGYWSVLGIHEKMNKIWTHVMLSAKASEQLEKYLRERFNLPDEYTGRKLEDFILQYVKEVRKEVEMNKERWLEMYRKAQQKAPKERNKIYTKIGNEFLKLYRKTLLFPISPQDIHDLVYVLAYRALEQGKPLYLSVTKGRPIKLDMDTVYRLQHKGHLFRKSFVQNLLNKGIAMEIVSEFNVGWEDLTTLKLFYGHLPEGRRIFTYLVAVRNTF